MFSTENPLLFVELTLSALCNMSALSVQGPIPPNCEPVLIGVEEVRGKDAPQTTLPDAIRYIFTLPGSKFMRIAVKVVETRPSITQAELDAQGGQARVHIEGFESGCFLTKDGGARPYFKAKKITPVLNSPGTGKA